MNIYKNIDPKLSTGTAVIVGYLLIDDLNSIEQNILGNWLMLVAQVLCTNAYFKQEEEVKNTKKDIDNVSYQELLKKMVNVLNKEISNLEK